MSNGILFGACYYPEHWPEERWPKDARLMREAHINIVRMAEFAWMRLEPREGEYDFSWLDKAVDLMQANGIRVMLGTPTAAPPKWLVDQYPDIYQRDLFGRAKGFGTRRHYCYDNVNYQRYVRRIVTAMAEHYKDHPNVVAWQIDNEFGVADTTRGYNDETLAGFQQWLEARYGTIDALNEAWGTIFSSQTFQSWEQVHLPAYSTHQLHNPSLKLDYYRYCSESIRGFQKLQVDIIRGIAPHQPISTNEMGEFNEIDYYDLSADLDFVSLDVYPNFPPDNRITSAYPALHFDISRGAKMRNFWVTELQSGTPGGNVLKRTPKPGELRRWTFQALAHGADALIYFRWRTLTFALEEFWHGILQHHGEPGRKYAEVRQTGEELARIGSLLAGTVNRPDVAIVRCYDNDWVFDIQPQMEGYSYLQHLKAYYRFFHEHSIETDLISPNADFSRYKLVVLPNLMMSNEHVQEKIYAYVRSGGRVVMDYRAGAKHWDNRMLATKLPGPYKELLGIEIEDYGVLMAGEENHVRFVEAAGVGAGVGAGASASIGASASTGAGVGVGVGVGASVSAGASVGASAGASVSAGVEAGAGSSAGEDTGVRANESAAEYRASAWYDVIELNEAKPLLLFEDDYYAGSAAATVNDYGSGRAYYLGTEPDANALRLLLSGICEDSGVRAPFGIIDAGVEVVTRGGEAGQYRFVINHNAHEAGLVLDDAYEDLLSGEAKQGRVTLQPNAVLVLK
ncbi:beta-galactosidase [Paenibacillus rhizovicinus]|uniref:beta-galactosidase n=1 Tax=Paenibacillus rhizovicinus TaxID=2704463 RepID=A0A6C0NY18_9BACL|nr:beta-galactosidase [Paenibacillus rhizovicinus]QHW31107.1 beta-galactosidase [Paenibacillus rhizovicinus]